MDVGPLRKITDIRRKRRLVRSIFPDLGRHGEDQLAPVDEVSLAKLVVASTVVPWKCWKRL